MLSNQSWHFFAGSFADRFGDHGVVSLLVAKETATAWKIDVLLLSCRVLGRGFEQLFTTSVIEYLRRKRIFQSKVTMSAAHEMPRRASFLPK